MKEVSLLLVVLICCHCCVVGYVSALSCSAVLRLGSLGRSDTISHRRTVERFGVGRCRTSNVLSWIRCLRVEDISCFYVVGDSLSYIFKYCPWIRLKNHYKQKFGIANAVAPDAFQPF